MIEDNKLGENIEKLNIGSANNADSKVSFLSWNIAGIRASCKRGDLDFLKDGLYDIICFQETKAEPAQIEPMISVGLKEIYKYRYWGVNPGTSQRKGFSGVAVWSKFQCIRLLDGMALDTEGRINALEFDRFVLVNVYTPNSQELGCERFEFRKLWDLAFYEYLMNLSKMFAGKPIIVCGDFNVAYLDIDLHNPKKYKNKVAGFLDDERGGFGRYIGEGVPPFVDTFRYINGDVGSAYTYWNQRMPHLRKKNIGWRIDYFLVSEAFKHLIRKAYILPEVIGSDHCPVILELVC
jgi:exodeoxyribonuclease III